MALIIESAPNAMLMTDETGTIVLVNAQTEKLFGYPRAELLGQTMELLLPARLRAQHPGRRREFADQPVARPMGARRDLFGLRKDGTEVPLEIGLNPVIIADESFVLASLVDVTERKREEDAVRRQHHMLRTLIDTLPVFIYEKDLQRRFLTANSAVARLMGRNSPEELLGKRDEDFYPEPASAEFLADEEKVLRGESIVNKNEPHLDEQGRRIEVLTTKVPLRDPAGKIVGLIGISRDITELKQKEQALQAVLAEREKLVAELQETLRHAKTLRGLLPMCAFCHKIRNKAGTWERLESYISSRTEADFTHGFCPECNEKHYGVQMLSKPPGQ